MTQPFQQPNLSLKNLDDMQHTSHSLSNPMSWRLKNKWKWLETGSRRCIQSPVIINNQVASTRPTLHLSADTEQREERVSPECGGRGPGHNVGGGCDVSSPPAPHTRGDDDPGQSVRQSCDGTHIKLHNGLTPHRESSMPEFCWTCPPSADKLNFSSISGGLSNLCTRITR